MTEQPGTQRPSHARLTALGLAVGSFALFAYRIAQPPTVYFDETHYVPAARALIAHSGPVNIEHPLFAKTMIAAGIVLLGDNSLGWRLPSAFFAATSVVALFWIALMMFRQVRPALLAALLLVFNQTLFIQARIAMLEMPMTACILLGAGCLMRARRVTGGGRRWDYVGAIMLGLAVGSKWLAIPYAALFLGATGWSKSREHKHELGAIIDHVLPDMAKLGLVVALTYLATFWPAFLYTREPMTLGHLLGFQFEMLRVQSGHMQAHPYQSDWWQWPLMLRPIWYLFTKSNASYEAVLLIGNPVIYWGGVVIVLLAASGWLRRRSRNLQVALGVYLFSLATWILIPKQIGFFYYYNLSAIALCLVIASFLESYGARGLRVLGWFTALSGAMFIYFYPIISAQPLPTDDTWTNWVWMKSWY